MFWKTVFVILKFMSAQHANADPLVELENYLRFLKDSGYTEIPLEEDFNSLLCNRPITPSPVAQPISPPNTEVRMKKDRHDGDAAGRLQAVREEMGNCTRCKLSEGRANIVFGSGNPNARLMFVGEGPGADEDAQGLPFVGRAGKKLTEIIEKGIGLNREKDVYICNIVKCRPPGNRDPEKDEIEACQPFLLKQIEAIRPKVIVALGRPAASVLLGRKVAITKERGTWHDFHGSKLILTFHPAYLLRAYTLENRQAVFEDMKQALMELNR